jgi:hypothetical protein
VAGNTTTPSASDSHESVGHHHVEARKLRRVIPPHINPVPILQHLKIQPPLAH